MQPIRTADHVNDYIDQSLHETLVLMKRFEDTGMHTVMKDGYLRLYDIYKRPQEQKQTFLQPSALQGR